MITPHLNGHHRRTLAAIFMHPAPHNIEWHDVLSLLGATGTVTERHSGSHAFMIGDHELVLHHPHGHDLVDGEMRDLRAFLTKAGFSSHGGPGQWQEPTVRDDWGIVMIDHHQARLYAPPAKPGERPTLHIIRPNDDDGSRRRVEHKQGNDDHDGGRASEDEAYYHRIADELSPASHIVVLSDGKGRSSAGEYLIDHIKRHDPALTGRIVASEKIDISQTSDDAAVAAGLALLKV